MIASIAPAAPNEWPIMLFVELIGTRPNRSPIALPSAASLNSVAVPCAFAQNHARAISIERTAFFWRRRLKRIKPNEDQFRKRVIPAGQHPFVAAGSHALKRVTDRVRAGSAGIRNYLAWRGDFEGFLGIDHRLLRRIIRDPGRRISQAAVSI